MYYLRDYKGYGYAERIVKEVLLVSPVFFREHNTYRFSRPTG